MVLLWFSLTSFTRLARQQATPTAADVAAGRDAYRQLRTAKGSQAGTWVQLRDSHLSGLSILASHGFRPDRLDVTIESSQLSAKVSHHLPQGGWHNVTLHMEGPSSGLAEHACK